MRRFLWPGGENECRDHLSRWEVRYESQYFEGLGIRNLRSKSLSLLAKFSIAQDDKQHSWK